MAYVVISGIDTTRIAQLKKVFIQQLSNQGSGLSKKKKNWN